MAEPLELPPGSTLHSFAPRQAPARGGIYLAMMDGDLETLFGPARELRDREFLLEVDGQQWIATPMPGLTVANNGNPPVMIFDTGGVRAQTDGTRTSIHFELIRRRA